MWLADFDWCEVCSCVHRQCTELVISQSAESHQTSDACGPSVFNPAEGVILVGASFSFGMTVLT
jgi:hypothetical protein